MKQYEVFTLVLSRIVDGQIPRVDWQAFDARANELGQVGWQLIAVVGPIEDTDVVAIFKRQVEYA